MSKRKVQFEDVGRDELESDRNRVKIKPKHTLDSDEEDDDPNDKYDLLDDEDVEGQEDSTIDFDGGIKITPFNMKEEMEEGHFDTAGNYFLKDEEKIKDHWMDNIDWVKVKATENVDSSKDQDSDDDEESITEESKISSYKQMLEIMKTGENVLKTLKRLGGSGGKVSASSRWLKKKKVSDEKNEENESNKISLEKLTSLADNLLQCGEFEIYQHTFEKLSFLVKEYDEKVAAQKTHIPDGTGDDDALDMFADSLDSKVGDKNDVEKDQESMDSDKKANGDDVMWEFKWQNEDAAEIHGPHSSTEMNQWVQDGYFPDGVFVRKVSQGSVAPFYSSSRIDFDLYI